MTVRDRYIEKERKMERVKWAEDGGGNARGKMHAESAARLLQGYRRSRKSIGDLTPSRAPPTENRPERRLSTEWKIGLIPRRVNERFKRVEKVLWGSIGVAPDLRSRWIINCLTIRVKSYFSELLTVRLVRGKNLTDALTCNLTFIRVTFRTEDEWFFAFGK